MSDYTRNSDGSDLLLEVDIDSKFTDRLRSIELALEVWNRLGHLSMENSEDSQVFGQRTRCYYVKQLVSIPMETETE